MAAKLSLYKLAYRNVLRNKRRTLLTSIVITVSVGAMLFMFSYIKGTLDMMIEDSIKISGHVNIRNPDYKLKERMLSLSAVIENYSSMKSELSELDHIKMVSGRIKFGGLLDFNEKNEPGLGMAIDTNAERELLKIENSIVKGSYFTGDMNETIVGRGLAENIGADVGDIITLISKTSMGSMAAANFKIVAIADMLTGALNKLFYIPLQTAQYVLDMEDMVTEIVVYSSDISYSNNVKDAILKIDNYEEKYSTLIWSEQNGLKTYLPLLNVTYFIMIGLFGLISSFSIINTMLMSVLERKNEIGVMTSFGMKKKSILKIFVIESGIIGLLGSIVGVILGGAGGLYLEIYGLNLGKIAEDLPMPMRQVMYADIEWYHLIISLMIGIIFSMAAAVLPAFKAAKLDPAEALRAN